MGILLPLLVLEPRDDVVAGRAPDEPRRRILGRVRRTATAGMPRVTVAIAGPSLVSTMICSPCAGGAAAGCEPVPSRSNSGNRAGSGPRA